MSKGYIICVDDEVTVLETLSEQLRSKFSATNIVETATSAEDALALIDEIQSAGEVIEVIITDQIMPGMKGDRFLEEIHRKLPDSIKIMLTGQAGLDSAIHAINRGGLNRYIEKPWKIEELATDIENLTKKFRQNIENLHLLNDLNKRIFELEQENKNFRSTPKPHFDLDAE